MSLLDKIKNALFEEEYVEVEKKEPKKEIKKEPKRLEPEIKKEKVEVKQYPKVEERKEDIDDDINDVPEKKEEPVFVKIPDEKKINLYDDDDFDDYKEEVKKEIKEEPVIRREEVYKEEVKEKVPYSSNNSEVKKFKPTPIISPIFGILDQNYRKEDIHDKKDIPKSSSYTSSRIDLDSVRKKAYGNLNDDFDLSGNDSIKAMEEEKKQDEEINELENNLLYDMSDTTSKPVVNKVTLADAEEYFNDLGLEYNVDYKDDKYERSMGRVVRSTTGNSIEKEEEMTRTKDDEEYKTKIEETIEMQKMPELTEVKPIIELEKKKEIELEEKPELSNTTEIEDNLFDLIDSLEEDK